MQPYMPLGRLTEDPLDGPFPTRKTKWAGAKRRAAKKRKSRSHKKGARQRANPSSQEGSNG